jgi:hypothetical protein
MRPATLEVRLEEIGELRFLSRPRVSNDNPYSVALFCTAKYRQIPAGVPQSALCRQG